jgi:SAM-dependent methyltransferase
LSIDNWIDAVGDALESNQQTKLNDVAMPTGPSEELQKRYVGTAGKQAMRDAALVYKYVLDACQTHGIQDIGRLLDFGCGWGRFTRLFLRDIADGGLFGIDPQPAAIHVCRTHIPQASFIKTEPYPPLPFRDQFFDVVFANSVFSHLAELPAYAWICEISRVLRPGGVLIATTHPLWLLDLVEKLRSGQVPITSPWHTNLSKSWLNLDETRRQYEKGGFLFAEEVGEYGEGYGDVIVSPGYIEKVWGKLMEPIDFVADRTRMSQAAFVLRKRDIA